MSISRPIIFSACLSAVVFAACLSAVVAIAPASAQTEWNLPAAYPPDNPHSENLTLFAKDVADATDGKLQITVTPGHRCSGRRKSSAPYRPAGCSSAQC